MSKKKPAPTQPPRRGRKKEKAQAGFSLALKLNSRLIGRLFGLLILLNLLFAGVILAFTAHKMVENGTVGLTAIFAQTTVEPADLALPPGFALAESTDHQEKWQVPVLYGTILEKNGATNIRSYLGLPLRYRLYFTYDNIDWCYAYDLGADFEFWRTWAVRLLVVEVVILVITMISWASMIRRTLKPIAEMERAARLLKESTPKELDRLVGRISTIEASDLATRLPVNEAQEELRGLAQSINDLLERIDEAYRSQARFVSDASHELRTPIAVIQGYANLLDRWGKEDEKTLQESINAIKNEADHMKDLVEQLLFLARGDNETMAVNLEVFDLTALAAEVFRESQMIDASHDLQFQQAGPAVVEADSGLLKQAMRVLIDNSIKYTPAGERITVKAGVRDGEAFFMVQDNGIGIVPEDLPYIFDRFYRSDESRARKTGGTGLGLAIVKWIVHRHGGRMEVMSRKDFGTRITAVLPLSSRVC